MAKRISAPSQPRCYRAKTFPKTCRHRAVRPPDFSNSFVWSGEALNSGSRISTFLLDGVSTSARLRTKAGRSFWNQEVLRGDAGGGLRQG